MTIRTFLTSLALGTALVLASMGMASAAEPGAPHLDGAALDVVWIVPFVGMLLSIAVVPLLAPHFWHQNFGMISAGWSVLVLAPLAVIHGPALAVYELLHVALGEYIPFIILLTSLFVVAGGIRIKGSLAGTPGFNTAILAIGTVLASIMGTTGAAMLLIRPLLRANEHRKYRVHTVVFFIFLVANIGGSLTPLGDPPLFLGFLQGVPFFWTLEHLFLPMLFLSIVLLALFFVVDTLLFGREGRPDTESSGERIGIEGGINFLLLAGILVSVLLSGIWRSGVAFNVYHVEVRLENLTRDLLLIGITAASLRLTSKESRRRNGFSWFPIVEVAKLFAGIFITIVPALSILRAGEAGALASVVGLVSDEAGQPIDVAYFWITGMLSSFLDNAPTYLVFFNTAGGSASELTGSLASTLTAISCGAVFMGANTYIGNAPNFMVRSIAQERGVPMPSFFGYMIWSTAILIPLFAVMTLIFF